jgi:hypothetical protein
MQSNPYHGFEVNCEVLFPTVQSRHQRVFLNDENKVSSPLNLILHRYQLFQGYVREYLPIKLA